MHDSNSCVRECLFVPIICIRKYNYFNCDAYLVNRFCKIPFKVLKSSIMSVLILTVTTLALASIKIVHVLINFLAEENLETA